MSLSTHSEVKQECTKNNPDENPWKFKGNTYPRQNDTIKDFPITSTTIFEILQDSTKT